MSGSVRTTITSGQTAVVTLGDGFIYVLVHFPAPLSAAERQRLQARVTQPAGTNWRVEVKNPPTGDTYAFGLRGNVPDDLAIEVTPPTNTPLRFTIRVGCQRPDSPPARHSRR
jgi:hypothetical protein